MINKATILGRVGKDPVVRDNFTGLSVATTESWKDKDSGERKEKTEWHNVIIFGGLAEYAGRSIVKGDLVYIEGSLETRKHEDKYSTSIKCDRLRKISQGQVKPRQDDHIPF